MLLEKYEPKGIKQVIGNKVQIKEITDFLKNWKKGSALFVYGPTGCGKTLAARLAAKEFGFDIVESHASDERGKEGFEELISIAKQSGVFSKKKAILVEDAEIIESKGALARLITESSHPVVITAENPYELNMPAVLKLCKLVRFRKIDELSVFRFLETICRKEKIKRSDKMLKEIIKSADGDVRAALIDLEIGSALRERSSNIFEVVRMVFAKENARDVLEVSAYDNLFLWVDENIPEEFKSPEDIAAAYDCLSKADVFRARIIRRQAWNLQKYFADFLLAMPQKKRRLNVFYKPPARLQRINQQTLEKIAGRLHVSRKNAAAFLPVVKLFLDGKMAEEFGFDEDDTESIKAF